MLANLFANDGNPDPKEFVALTVFAVARLEKPLRVLRDCRIAQRTNLVSDCGGIDSHIDPADCRYAGGPVGFPFAVT